MQQSPSWKTNRTLTSRKFSTFNGTPSFITAFTSTRQLSLFREIYYGYYYYYVVFVFVFVFVVVDS